MGQHLATLAALAALGTLPVAARAQPADAGRPAAGVSATASRATLVWRGSQRSRYSALHNQFRPGLEGDDEALSLQTLIGATVSRGRFSFTGELQDARAYLTDGNSAISTIIVNTAEVLQAYIGIELTPGRGSVDLTLGRFTMDQGSRRYIARQTFRNSITDFTGIKAEWSPASGGTLTAFAVMPVDIRPDDRNALLDNDRQSDYQNPHLRFTGMHYARDLPPGFRGEIFAYDLDERDDTGTRESSDREMTTAGVRALRRPAVGQWDFEIESVWQNGRRRATKSPADLRTLDIDTRYVHAGFGYTFARPWPLRLGVEYDAAGGDRDPDDDAWQRFDSLFGPRRADLGPTGIYGPLGRDNLRSAGVRVTINPNDRLDAFFVYRSNRLDEARDTFARTGVRDPAGASGRDGGEQLELRARYWLVPAKLRVEFGAAWFRNGRFLETAPNATREGNTTFWYSDLTYRFGSDR